MFCVFLVKSCPPSSFLMDFWVSDPRFLQYLIMNFKVFQNFRKSLQRRLPSSKIIMKALKITPKCLQELPKRPPRSLQELPKTFQESPRSSQEAPRSPKELPKRPQGLPRALQESQLVLRARFLMDFWVSDPRFLQYLTMNLKVFENFRKSLLGQLVVALRALLGALGSLSVALGPLLGALGGTFGRSWVTLGRSWIAFGRSWDGFGCPWITLGCSWGTLGRSWAILGRFGMDLGLIFTWFSGGLRSNSCLQRLNCYRKLAVRPHFRQTSLSARRNVRSTWNQQKSFKILKKNCKRFQHKIPSNYQKILEK